VSEHWRCASYVIVHIAHILLFYKHTVLLHIQHNMWFRVKVISKQLDEIVDSRSPLQSSNQLRATGVDAVLNERLNNLERQVKLLFSKFPYFYVSQRLIYLIAFWIFC